jgi:hypothetical protein
MDIERYKRTGHTLGISDVRHGCLLTEVIWILLKTLQPTISKLTYESRGPSSNTLDWKTAFSNVEMRWAQLGCITAILDQGRTGTSIVYCMQHANIVDSRKK